MGILIDVGSVFLFFLKGPKGNKPVARIFSGGQGGMATCLRGICKWMRMIRTMRIEWRFKMVREIG